MICELLGYRTDSDMFFPENGTPTAFLDFRVPAPVVSYLSRGRKHIKLSLSESYRRDKTIGNNKNNAYSMLESQLALEIRDIAHF